MVHALSKEDSKCVFNDVLTSIYEVMGHATVKACFNGSV